MPNCKGVWEMQFSSVFGRPMKLVLVNTQQCLPQSTRAFSQRQSSDSQKNRQVPRRLRTYSLFRQCTCLSAFLFSFLCVYVCACVRARVCVYVCVYILKYGNCQPFYCQTVSFWSCFPETDPPPNISVLKLSISKPHPNPAQIYRQIYSIHTF